jgi:hypothetical protein
MSDSGAAARSTEQDEHRAKIPGVGPQFAGRRAVRCDRRLWRGAVAAAGLFHLASVGFIPGCRIIGLPDEFGVTNR